MKLSADSRHRIVLVMIAFLLYALTLSKGAEMFDTPIYIKETTKCVETMDCAGFFNPDVNQHLRNPLYIALTLPVFFLSSVTGISVEFLLNFFSVVPAIITSVVIYNISRLFFKQRESFLSAILFVTIPFVWFNSIIADRYSLLFLMGSIWLYSLMLSMKDRDARKSDRHMLVSTVFLTLSVFTHILAAPLAIVQAYFILKRGKLNAVLKNAAVFLTCVPLLIFFASKIFIERSDYAIVATPGSVLFSSMLLVWNAVNSFSLPLLAFFVASVAYAFRRRKSGMIGQFLTCFLLSFIVYLPTLAIPHYIMVQNFSVVFIFVPVLVMFALSRLGKASGAVLAVLMVFMILKALPIMYNLSQYYHPHELYAKFAAETLPSDSIVVVGHEYPFYDLYTNFTLYAEGDSPDLAGAVSAGRVYVTSQYFESENDVELMEFKSSCLYSVLSGNYRDYSSLTSGAHSINITAKTLVVEYPRDGEIRDAEDTFECFYSIYRNPVMKAFLCSDLPHLDYKIYKVDKIG
jgi:hypothetical protein